MSSDNDEDKIEHFYEQIVKQCIYIILFSWCMANIVCYHLCIPQPSTLFSEWKMKRYRSDLSRSDNDEYRLHTRYPCL